MAAGAFAASMLLAACSSGGGAASGDAASGPVGTWGPGGTGKAQLVLTEDGKVSGTDGCNQLNGSWTDDAGKVTFGMMASTLMACDGVDTWLSGLNAATVSGSTMTVLDVNGAEIGTLDKQ